MPTVLQNVVCSLWCHSLLCLPLGSSVKSGMFWKVLWEWTSCSPWRRAWYTHLRTEDCWPLERSESPGTCGHHGSPAGFGLCTWSWGLGLPWLLRNRGPSSTWFLENRWNYRRCVWPRETQALPPSSAALWRLEALCFGLLCSNYHLLTVLCHHTAGCLGKRKMVTLQVEHCQGFKSMSEVIEWASNHTSASDPSLSSGTAT